MPKLRKIDSLKKVITLKEYQETYSKTIKQRPHKLNAKKAWHKGRCYPSIAERDYAMKLDTETENYKAIWRQVPCNLGEDTTYRVDFLIIKEKEIYAVDVKGFETKEFKRIKKLWKKYGQCSLRVLKKKKKKNQIVFVCDEIIDPDEIKAKLY